MRATRVALLALICLSFGFGRQAFAAPLANSRSQTPLESDSLSESPDSADDDIEFPSQRASVQSMLSSLNAADAQAPEVLPNVAPDADVAPDLANELNPNYGVMGQATDAPLCCPSMCCRPCPSWTFSTGAIFLNQTSPGHSPVLTAVREPRTRPGPSLLTANQFNPGVRFGYEFDAIRHNVGGSCWDLEARYFGINRWNATAPTITTNAAIPFAPLTIPVAGAGSQTTALYQSLLQNVELNARRSISPWLQLIAGLRYVAYDDSTSVTSVPTVGIGTTRFSTIRAQNNLIGPQIGANAFLWQRGRAGVQAFGKGGVYGNVTSNSTSVNNGVFASSAHGGHTSFVGELGVTGTYRLTRNWALRTTYEMLWLDGVARSPDQIASSHPIAGTGSVTPYGTVLYYGGFVGLEYYR